MKQKYKVIDNTSGKVIEVEKETQNSAHFETQIKFKAHVFKPKKGSGSFKRKNKYPETDE